MIVVLHVSLVVIFISLTNLKLCFETFLCSDQSFLCQAEGCCRYDRHNLKEDCVTKRRILKRGQGMKFVRVLADDKRDKRPSSFSVHLLKADESSCAFAKLSIHHVDFITIIITITILQVVMFLINHDEVHQHLKKQELPAKASWGKQGEPARDSNALSWREKSWVTFILRCSHFFYKRLFSPVLISSVQMLQHSWPCRILPREREPGGTLSPFVHFWVSYTWVLRQASPAPNNKETNTRISILTIFTEGIEQFLPAVPDILPWCHESLFVCIPKWRRVREEKETTKESKRVCKESWKGCNRWYQDQHLNLLLRFDNDRQVVLITI